MSRYETTMSAYIYLIWTHSINNVTTSTGIHTLHIIDTCLQTNKPGTLYTYISQHCHSSLPYIPHVTLLNKYDPQMSYLYQKWPLIPVQIWNNYISIFTSYQPLAFDIVITDTGIHTLHFIGICPWWNRSATVHIYVPLHDQCSLHMDLTLLHIYGKYFFNLSPFKTTTLSQSQIIKNHSFLDHHTILK